jgi:succinoglycan biosynthesis protein ExoM
MLIAICIASFKRPNGLRRLLTEINKLEFIKNPDVRIKLIVIDNDADSSANNVCGELRPLMRWPLEYHVEPERGIPFARNSALFHAGKDPDFIAFIDDDEVPDRKWLDELLYVREAYGADAVNGPVISRFEDKVPGWVIKGNFYQRQRTITGAICKSANTGNVLIKNEVIRKEGLAFNKQFALTGASDDYFFREFTKKGFKIIWANDAIVYEFVPPSRINLRWLMQRSYRGGLYFTFVQLRINPGKKLVLVRVCKGILRILFGISVMILSIFRGYHTFVSGAQSVALGCGTFAGLFGIKYHEYKKIHGS